MPTPTPPPPPMPRAPYNHDRRDSPRTPCLRCLLLEFGEPGTVVSFRTELLVSPSIAARIHYALRAIGQGHSTPSPDCGPVAAIDEFVLVAVLRHLATIETERS